VTVRCLDVCAAVDDGLQAGEFRTVMGSRVIFHTSSVFDFLGDEVG
jgi:hypothetical protein